MGRAKLRVADIYTAVQHQLIHVLNARLVEMHSFAQGH